jgi:hypothetical protein
LLKKRESLTPFDERGGGGLAGGVGGADPSVLVVVPVGHGVAVDIGLFKSHFVKSGELTPVIQDLET